MSRCFPFTPRGVVREELNNGAALIETIKLQSATEKSQTNRKKEKKTRKEDRKKPRDICDGKVKSLGEQKAHEQERRTGGVKRKLSPKGNERVEKSDLTEEHGQSLYFQSSAYLSDGTQSSCKRKNDTTLLNHYEHPKRSHIIRIRINPEKQSDRKNETLEKQSSFATIRPDETVHESKRRSEPAAGAELPCLATGNRKISTPVDDKACSTSTNRNTSHKDRVEALELQHKNLIDNWIPERLQYVVDDVDDADWLFGTRHSEGPSSSSNLKRHKATSTTDQSCRGVSLWPQAQYLPEAGIYALPYSLPY